MGQYWLSRHASLFCEQFGFIRRQSAVKQFGRHAKAFTFNLIHGVLEIFQEAINVNDSATAALIEEVQAVHQLVD
jgi:phenylpyruvate tautomerase PptA (4-oxalocrotonate tautomerase family)